MSQEQKELEKEDEEWEDEEWEEIPYLELDDEKIEITDVYITESRPIRRFYVNGWRGAIPAPIRGKSGTIIRRALQYCKDRGEIRKKHWKDQNILQQKLKLFDDDFFQNNQTDAFDLADVACRLQIKSLYYLMRKRAAEMLAQKSSDDICKIMKIYYVEDKTTDRQFHWMIKVVRSAGWAFRQIITSST